MTITATRNEDEGFLSGLFTGKKVIVDPHVLAAKALGSFQEAADNLIAAQEVISKQKEEHVAAIEALQDKARACDEQGERLSRVAARFRELIA